MKSSSSTSEKNLQSKREEQKLIKERKEDKYLTLK